MLDPEKFATVKIHVTGKDDSSKYILQLLDGNNALKQEKRDVTTGDWQFNFVPAGEIKFRVIEDKNGNGKWDTGNVVERRQPERAEIYANDEGEDTFATKANWEVEFSIDMNTLFARFRARLRNVRPSACAARPRNAPRNPRRRVTATITTRIITA